MVSPKVKSDVWGYANACPNFIQCSFCYGCRNFDVSNEECVTHCGDDRKKNVCNKQKHRADVIAKFVHREPIIIGN